MRIFIPITIVIIFPFIVFASCSPEGMTVVYINGILTTKVDAQKDLSALQVEYIKKTGDYSLNFKTGYNESHIGGFGDLIESTSQLFNYPISNYDRDNILRQIHPEVTTRKILLVGHSQGTFYTNEIYNYLLANGEQKGTVGVYNLATPASYVSGGGGYLTSENDKVINSVRVAAQKVGAKQPLSANINISLSEKDKEDSFGGHSFNDAYLNGAAGRIVSEINDSLKKLVSEDVLNLLEIDSATSSQTGCFTPPPKDASYYTQKTFFVVSDTATNGAVAVGSGVIVAGKIVGQTAYAVGNIVYNGAIAAGNIIYDGAVVLGQTAIKIGENIYTNIGTLVKNIPFSKGLALIGSSIGSSEQPTGDTIATSDNSETQDTSNDNQATNGSTEFTVQENLSQLALDTPTNTGSEFSATPEESSTSLGTDIPDPDGISSSTAKSESDNPKYENSNSETTTTPQNNNISVGGGGSNAPPSGGTSAALASSVQPQQVSLTITEIMYDVPGADTGHEWVEIFNNGTSTADITQLKFFESDTNHKLNIVQGSSTLAPGNYAVLADSSSTFLSDYPGYTDQLFSSSFSLSNNGETIAIKNGDTIVNEVAYTSSTGANGDGNSLQLINGSWQATLPTPGKENKITNKPPNALFKFSPANPKVSSTILFDSSSSTDPDGNIISYSWDFGDGQSTTTSQATTTYSYGSIGSYLIQLTSLDNSGSSSTATSTIEIFSGNEINHVVISEIQAGTTDDSKSEFVEFYNPTNQAVNFLGWSLKRKTSSAATSTEHLVLSFSSTSTIQAQGFFLVAHKNYVGSTTPDFIYSNNSNPLSYTDDVLMLENASGSVIDEVAYQEIPAGKSLERKASATSTTDSMTNGSDRFLGNNYDTNSAISPQADLNSSDFVLRDAPNPQNFGNLPEPRNAPNINNLQVTYNFAPRFDFLWDLSADTNGSTSTNKYFVYDITNPSSTLSIFESTSTPAQKYSFSETISEIGRNYDFKLIVQDRDGLTNGTTTTALANSFLDKLYFYSSAPTSTSYFFDITTTSSRPFWDATNAGGYGGWSAIVFYLNKDAPKESILDTDHQLLPSDGSYARIGYEGCVGGGGNGSELIFPVNEASCVPGPLSAGAYNFTKLEDPRLAVGISDTNSGIPFSSSDYVTLAFYDYGGGRAGNQWFNLTAVDKTKYYFKDTPQNQNVPTMPGNFSANFDSVNGKLNLSWTSSTDADTLDYLINYQVNYSTSSALNDSDWQSVGTSLSTSTIPVYPNSYKIGVRAVDNFNNTSTLAIVDWNFPNGFVQLPSQLNYGDVVGGSGGAQKFFTSSTASITSVVLWGGDGGGSYGSSQSYIEIRKDNNDSIGDFVATSTSKTIWQYDALGEIVYTFAAPVQLEASSSYWIVAASGPSATANGTRYYGSIHNPYGDGYWLNHPGYDAYFRLAQ